MRHWLSIGASVLVFACGGTTGNTSSPPSEAGAPVCSSSGTSCPDGQTIESCAVPDDKGQCASIYYQLGSATFPCSSCTDFASCAMAAAQACGSASDGDAGLRPDDAQVGADDATDAAAEADEEIDPIAVGHAWTYAVTELGTYPACPAGSSTATALTTSTQDGKAGAVEVQSLCTGAPPSWYFVQGDVVQVDVTGTWVLALDAPVQEGHTWSNGETSFTWHDAGSVTVPAGTFSDCWSATENVAYPAYTIFCRGVGPVHWYTKDDSGDGFEAVLTTRNF
jgi:hypothetical protein